MFHQNAHDNTDKNSTTNLHSKFIESIRPFVDFVTHCPEVDIGLGAPRQFVRIVMTDNQRRFVQPATNRNLTNIMISYVENLIVSLKEIDGFVLKDGSPSCSINRVRYYSGPEKGAPTKTEGSGFFGGAVLDRFYGTPIESDGRLRNAKIRETFLTKIFMLADLRRVASSGKMHELVRYHSISQKISTNERRSPFRRCFNHTDREIFH
ncbi:DUF523 domain-containing protein [Candidatus Thorarchaeota archaeon]|nr:MAG: DUF523 domain-containing protein [Candidatus Thorarchaeota archaeon]